MAESSRDFSPPAGWIRAPHAESDGFPRDTYVPLVEWLRGNRRSAGRSHTRESEPPKRLTVMVACEPADILQEISAADGEFPSFAPIFPIFRQIFRPRDELSRELRCAIIGQKMCHGKDKDVPS